MKESNIESFQDITEQVLGKYKGFLSNEEYTRVKHVVTDNSRVTEMVRFLGERDFVSAGQCLLNGHKSLKYNFDITSVETDFLVRELVQHDVILGARQVGVGCGGCVLALAKDFNLDNVTEEIKRKYRKGFSLPLRTIPVRISNGCQVL